MNGVWLQCYKCKSDMWLPSALNNAARRGASKIEFFCPYGHGQVYTLGETEEVKLRRERDRLQQRLAEKDDTIAAERAGREAAERSASAMRGQVTRIKNRLAATDLSSTSCTASTRTTA